MPLKKLCRILSNIAFCLTWQDNLFYERLHERLLVHKEANN